MNKQYKIIFSALYFCLLLSNLVYAKNKFSVVINLPYSIDIRKIRISYNDGMRLIDLDNKKIQHRFIVEARYISTFATIEVLYPKDSNENTFYSNTFFVNDKHAEIFLLESSPNPLEKYRLKNALGIREMGEDALLEFDKSERSAYSTFMDDAINQISFSDSFVIKKANLLYKNLCDKHLEYIANNSESFFSLWKFYTEIVLSELFDADTLKSFFNKNFSSKKKNSFEGKQILSILDGRIATAKFLKSPSFKTTDISGHEVSLKKLAGKYILLNFWASWCLPCVTEFPQFNEFQNKYSHLGLTIVSVSRDESQKKCLQAIKQHKMHWINIWNDPLLENQFGHKGSIPQVYLIDTSGKIIYSRELEISNDLSLLKQLLEKIMR